MRKLRFFIISAAALLMLTACAAGNQASHEEPVTVVVSEDFRTTPALTVCPTRRIPLLAARSLILE